MAVFSLNLHELAAGFSFLSMKHMQIGIKSNYSSGGNNHKKDPSLTSINPSMLYASMATTATEMTNETTANGVGNSKQQRQQVPPHFVLVPLMAQGHMIPMVDLGILLARRGAVVSVITTPVNASRHRVTIDLASSAGLPIRFVELRFPCAEVGLPDGTENIDVFSTPEVGRAFFLATTLLQEPVEHFIRAQSPSPSCIIADLCHPWTRLVASNVGIPRLTFFSICCFSLLSELNIRRHNVFDELTDDKVPFAVPGLAEHIEVTKAQAPGFFAGWEEMEKDVHRAELEADGIVVNTFEAMEATYIEGYAKAMGKKVWSLGPFSLSNETIASMAARGNTATVDAAQCLSWLDSKKPGSAVYVSFGSLTNMKLSQLTAIGHGLEASNHPFVMVIKKSEIDEEVEEWIQGFEDRIGSKGLLIKGWAPQLMILSHPAVGGFMTHCGWNSTLEAITAGVALITWPNFGDQFLNERMAVDVLEVGISLGVKEPTKWGADGEGIVVSKEDVERAVRSLMEEEGEGVRERARKLGEKAAEAVKEGGSSHANMTNLIQHFSHVATQESEEMNIALVDQ